MVARLLLVRHGEVEGGNIGWFNGWGETVLGDEGLAQAAAVAQHIAREYRVSSLYSSPLRRAMQTAEIIAEAVRVAPIHVDNLREVDYGDAEGLTFEEFRTSYPHLYRSFVDGSDFRFTWPGGESRWEFHSRLAEAMSQITAANAGKTVVIISHRLALAGYLARMLTGDPVNWRDYSMKPGALSEFTISKKSVTSMRLNDTSFMKGFGDEPRHTLCNRR